jgi:hypothetical protein
MNKTEGYKEQLIDLMSKTLKDVNDENLAKYLASNSNLPGPRGNLELAEAFAQIAEEQAKKEPEKVWCFCNKLIHRSPSEAPTNSPSEFLVFCGARCIGVIGSSPDYNEKALALLKELANDPRWRTREAVAMAIQSLIKENPQKTLKDLEQWVRNEDWFLMRAVAAGVAEPPLLRNQETAKSSLKIHQKIFEKILSSKERNSTNFKTLKQGLSYTLSVVVCAIPKEGFAYIHQLLEIEDVDIKGIVKENLKKNRLIKNFPDEIALIKKM